jgi:hypothetical protein
LLKYLAVHALGNRKPSSAGIVKDFVGIGLGRFGTERPDGLRFRNISAI